MQAPPPRPRPVPLRIAHRGGAGLWPENTLTAFSHAISSGMDGIELDVHLSGDGVAVVHHDARLHPDATRRPAVPGPSGAGDQARWLQPPTPFLCDMTAQELAACDVGRARPGSSLAARHPQQTPTDGEGIPTLRQVLDLVCAGAGSDFRLFVELKGNPGEPRATAAREQLARAAHEEVARAGRQAQTVYLSFDWDVLACVRGLGPGSSPGPAIACTTSALRAASSLRTLQDMAAAGARGWCAWHRAVTARTMAQARDLGLEVYCWTVNSPGHVRRLQALGVDAIITDRPDILLTQTPA